MPADFFPKRESKIVEWSANFDNLINAAPNDFGLTRPQAMEYSVLHDAFAASYQAANSPGTRTPVIITAKNNARVALEAGARMLAKIVCATAGVTPAQRLSLGLAPRNPGGGGARPATPDESPLLSVVSMTGRTVHVRLRDRSSPMRDGVPRDRGIRGATIFMAIGDSPPPSLNLLDWTWAGHTTRSIADVRIPSGVAPGTKVWLSAFWLNTREERGPACEPICTHVQYGLAPAA